jgi:hypothetical protein
MIEVEWQTFQWRPSGPPDLAEYNLLRSLDESGMKQHLKVLLAKVRQELASQMRRSYRATFVSLAIAAVIFVLAAALNPGTGTKPPLSQVLFYGGWFFVFVAILHGASVSMTWDSIRKNLIVAREHYVRCWVAAQKLDFDRFTLHIWSGIERGPPGYELL